MLQRCCRSSLHETFGNKSHLSIFSGPQLYNIYTQKLYLKKGLTLFLEFCGEQPGKSVGSRFRLNPGNHPKNSERKVGGWMARDRQEERRKKKNLVENSQ